MPNSAGPSVIHMNGFDYWRTWFIQECDKSKFFGVTQINLTHLTSNRDGRLPYHVGTHIFLIDEPYFRATKNRHRICGPYEVVAIDENLPQDAELIHIVDNKIIVFKEAHPENGPWKNRRHVREIAGKNFGFDQIADEYNFFPYRFSIRRAPKFRQPCEIVRHQKNVKCWLC